MNKLEIINLGNGLTIYFYKDSRRHSTFFQFITLFGGLTKDFLYHNQEYHMHDGIAHILEHYIVEHNESGNFLEILGKKQMNTNASTHFNMTRFYFETVENIEEGIDILLNGLYNIKFDKEKLEKVKKPILQEIRGKQDNKFYHSDILMLNNVFHNNTFQSIGGTLQEVEETTIEELEICYDTFYQPNNQIIVVGGNFDKKKILERIKKFYNHYKTTEQEKPKLLTPKEEKEVVKKEDILIFKTPLDYVEITFKIDISNLSPSEKLDLDFYLVSFYNTFFGATSKLYKKLTEEKIISSSISTGDITINNYLLISIGAYTYNPEEFKRQVLQTIQQRKEYKEDLYELDKKSSILRLILRDENIMNMIMPFVDNLVNFNYPYLDTIEDLEKMTFKKFKDAIESLDFSNYTIIHIKEKEQ